MNKLKLYDDQDSDFKLYSRFKDVVFPEDDKVISVCKGYLCITSIEGDGGQSGEPLMDQLEMSLPHLSWFLAVKHRFTLKPGNGGYPPGEMSDIVQLDSENEVFVFRGANFANRGLMMFSLENRKRSSYILEGHAQKVSIYDKYFDECGLLNTFLEIQKDYEDGLI